ncbi:MAG TPA: hypothetical protein VFN10_21765, partial [Thermoanaerobaculia bacterium]|nr:hypothetical protein [Thermoanaerobaculia bacterium]
MVQGDGAFPGGTLDIDSSQGFEACAELFLSDRYSARLSATFLQPTAILFPSAPPPNDVDLGTLGITPIALTGRMHFRHGARIEPYGGAGAAIVILGNLDDQFGDDVDVNLDRPVTFVVEGGVRYQLRSLPVALEAGVSYMPITGTL